MKIKKIKKGFTFTPAIFIIVLLMMATSTYLIYVTNLARTEVKLESSAISKYVAESGIFHLKGKLAKMNAINPSGKIVNSWFNIKTLKYDAIPLPVPPATPTAPVCADYIFTSNTCDDASRNATFTQRTSPLIELRENPADPTSKLIGKYRVTIDDGEIVGAKTSTGSPISGYDRYNNKIWSDSTDKNYFKTLGLTRYGIRVDGFAVTDNGTEIKPAQSVYSVIDVPQSATTIPPDDWGGSSSGSGGAKAPASYMLVTNSTTDTLVSPTSENRLLNLLSNQVITGPIHTNEQFGFTWKGNFDININQSVDSSRSTKNDNFTVLTYRMQTPNTGDQTPLLVYQMGFLENPMTWKMTVFGKGFSSTAGLYYQIYSKTGVGNLTTWTSPLETGVAGNGDNYMKFDFPSSITKTDFPVKIWFYKNGEYLCYTLDTQEDIINLAPQEPLKVLGIMQASKKNLISEDIYKQSEYNSTASNDYRFIGSLLGMGATPYIAWDPPGNEPPPYPLYKDSPPFPINTPYPLGDAAKLYNVTYITNYNLPHRKIKVYSLLTYSSTSFSTPDPFINPKLYYIHSHKAEGKSYAPWVDNHEHKGSIFGLDQVNLLMNDKTTDYIYKLVQLLTYDWTFYHRHEISANLLSGTFSSTDDNFFFWESALYKPVLATSKIPPILVPNNVNSNTQRIYFNQIIKTILDKELTIDGLGNYQDPAQIAEDRDKGYYNANGSTIDFRSTYFGNDLKYTAGVSSGQLVLQVGSKISDTYQIYVNDKEYLDDPITVQPDLTKPNPDYLKIASSELNADYNKYTYRQIPKNASTVLSTVKQTLDGGIILVREGTVRIGGMDFNNLAGNGVTRGTGYVSPSAGSMGKNTIIDGRLTIISYSEVKPTTYTIDDPNITTDNPGDIVITGSIIYKNKIFPKKEQLSHPKYETHSGFRQYAASTLDIYKHHPYEAMGKDASGGNPTPTSVSDTISNIKWITELPDRSATPPAINKEGIPLSVMPKDPRTNDFEKLNSLALISSNDIKIPVMHYYQIDSGTSKEEEDFDPPQNPYVRPSMKDILTIHGQLIAGHQLTQTKAKIKANLLAPYLTVPSKNDQLVMFGSFYSQEQPDLSYFDRSPSNSYDTSIGRIYMFDKALSQVPLPGTPYFPTSTTNPYAPNNQFVASSNMPRIVPGTFKNISDGAN